jgi:polar amino acid transport system permease protein
MSFDFLVVFAQWPMLLRGVLLTVALTLVSALAGTLLGIACAWARVHGSTALRLVVGGYVELIRNTPFIIQLFFVFFGLPSLGIRFSPETASVLAMVLNLGGYTCEIVRAGIEFTPRGQLEAAQSLALNRWQTFSRVVLPPALARIWPALVSQIIIVMLGSAVCSQVSTEELTYAANQIASRTYRTFEAYFVVCAMYLGLAIALRESLNWIGTRFIFRRPVRRAA